MTTLIRLEFRRFWARKLMRNGVVILAALPVAYGAVQLFTHSAEYPSVESMEGQIEFEVAECRRYSILEWESAQLNSTGEPEYDQYLAQWESGEALADVNCNPIYFGGGHVEEPRFCFVDLWSETWRNTRLCPDVSESELLGGEAFSEDDFDREAEFNVEGETYTHPRNPNQGTLVGLSGSLLIVAIVVGASFVGAEYRAGTIENQLLWETRRTRIAAAKFTAVGVSAMVLHISALVFLMLAALPAAAFVGTFAGADGEFWTGVVSTVARGGLSAGLVAVASAALALIVRNTAGSVGVMMGYGIVVTGLLFWLAPSLTHVEIATNFGAFVTGGDVSRYLGDQWPRVRSHGPWMAGVVVATYSAAMVGLAITIFNRRDID